jgi:hypothetical protein
MNRKELKRIKKEIVKNGGLTLLPTLEKVNYKQGFMVSLSGSELKLNIKDLTIKHLKQYQKMAKDKKAFIVFWLDNNTLYLDLSIRMFSELNAKSFGKLNHQLAIYDLENQKSIYLD